jgi:MT0933-like antitoxin protein
MTKERAMFDKLKKAAAEAKDKVAETVDQHSEQISRGIDKAGSVIDEKTKGKYSDKIATGQQKVREGLDKVDGKKDDFPPAPPAPPAAGTPPPPAPGSTPPPAGGY